MKTNELTILAAVAGLGVVATAVVLNMGAPTIASDRRGEKVLPALESRGNELTGLTVRDGNDTLAIERRDNRFVAADSGFPIKTDAVRDVVVSSAQLTFEEARTSDPARYGDLGLADPGTPAGKDGSTAAGKEIVFRAGGSDIGDVVVGNRDASVGGAVGGLFVRIKGQPQTFLARGSVRLPSTRTDWYAGVEFDIKRNEIKTIDLKGGGRDEVSTSADKPGEFSLAGVPDGRVADTFKVSRLATLVDSFTFQDVRKAGTAPADGRRMTVETTDGLRLVFASVGDITEGWTRISAETTNTATDAVKTKAKGIAARIDGYEFRLPSNQAELIGWTVADLTNDKPAEQPSASPPINMRNMPPGMPPFNLQGLGGAAPQLNLENLQSAPEEKPQAQAPAPAEPTPSSPSAPAETPPASPPGP